MVSLATDASLGLVARFVVVIDGFDLGGWSGCKGLAVAFTLTDYKPLGHNGYLPLLPDRVVYDRVSLTRAVTAEDSAKVMSWLARMADGGPAGTAEITLFDARRRKVASWALRSVFPTKWTGPALDAGSAAVATETLELAHEGFLAS